MSTSIATTKTEELHESKTSRYQLLVLKKAALEKSLNEKYDQLHQLCKKVRFLAFTCNLNSRNFYKIKFFFFFDFRRLV